MSIDVLKIRLPPKVRMDCFRMALYPILKYNNADADLLFISRIEYLEYKEKLMSACIECIDLGELLCDFNIENHSLVLNDKEKILELIKKVLDNDFLVICFLDVFYYSPFKATFNKIHTVHGVPIYGYNDKKSVFYIIDSDYLASFNRVFLEVSYHDIVDSMIGYNDLKHFSNIKIYKKSENNKDVKSKKSIREKYAFEFKKKTSGIAFTQSVDFFDSVNDYISFHCTTEKEMISFCKETYGSIDQIINARMLEYYGVPFIFKNISTLQDLDAKIVQDSNYIRAIMYRTVYTGEFRKGSFENFPRFFQSIFVNEKKRMEFMYKFKWEDNIKKTIPINSF